MTVHRIFATAKPSDIGAKVLPMSEEDRRFWEIVNAPKRPMEQPRPSLLCRLRSVLR